MKIFKTITKTVTAGNSLIRVITRKNYNEFSENILNLGDLETKSNLINGISVMFDLEGFTSFCKQIDPQLAVPEYLSEFLPWIFREMKEGLILQEHPEGFENFAPFPFLSKFLGDGLLFLWDVEKVDEIEITNIVSAMFDICENYEAEFYPKISQKLTDVPKKLRCGIARGAMYSVGNGEDFVGPCINMSARLQKLHSLRFCFSRRGINPDTMEDSFKKMFIVKKVDIRGIGENELVCVLKDEFNKLPVEQKKFFT